MQVYFFFFQIEIRNILYRCIQDPFYKIIEQVKLLFTCVQIKVSAFGWWYMMFQRIQTCLGNRDRCFHFMGHIVDEVSLHFIDPFLFSNGLIHKHESYIANEQDEEECQHRPEQIIYKKVVVVFKLGKDQGRIKKYALGIGGKGICLCSFHCPCIIDPLRQD